MTTSTLGCGTCSVPLETSGDCTYSTQRTRLGSVVTHESTPGISGRQGVSRRPREGVDHPSSEPMGGGAARSLLPDLTVVHPLRRPLRPLLALIAGAVLSAALPATAQAKTYWFDTYERGKDSFVGPLRT